MSWDANRAICHVAQASFVVSILAAMFYGLRLLLEAVKILLEATQPPEERSLGLKYNRAEELELLRVVEINRVQEQALSPVLAFFPDTSPRPWR